MRRLIPAALLAIALASAGEKRDGSGAPQATISNGMITAKLYLPDTANGYYQGTRFDWSGVFASLTYKGHEYFGPWFDRYDPKIHDSISDLPGATKAREVLVKRALEYLDSLSQESADQALQRELAAAYERIGDVQGNNTSANQDDFAGASASYSKAVAIREMLVAKNPADPNLGRELAEAYLRSVMASDNVGDFASEFRTLDRARWVVSRLSAAASSQQKQFSMAGIYYYTARALEKTGKFSEALESYQKTVSLLAPLARSPHASLMVRSYLDVDYIEVGEMQALVGRASEAKASAKRATSRWQ